MKQPAPEFWASSPMIDAGHPQIRALAQHLTAGRSGYQQASAIAADSFVWVRDRIAHAVDLRRAPQEWAEAFGDRLPSVLAAPVPCCASDVLRLGTSLCYGKSHLLAALLRAQGLAAALCYQRLVFDETAAEPTFCLHGMVAVWLPEVGWYRCDPRGNGPSINAQFTPPVEALAFSLRFAGEADLNGFEASPRSDVIAAMTQARSFAELIADLPSG